MGILNVTPDSFFDGGKYAGVSSALKQAEKMVTEGADILDVGGESSRPGSNSVPLEEELKRVIPVVKKLVKKFPKVPISVDTQKSEVAYQSLNEGAQIVNDISALRSDRRMIKVLQEFKPKVVLMHMRGVPQTMQRQPRYKKLLKSQNNLPSVVQEIKRFLLERIHWITQNGLPRKNIWIDPGIGFGKTVRHNLEILKNLRYFFSLNCPLLVGCSRKSFIGSLLGRGEVIPPPKERLEGTLATACWSYLMGVSILRVHDVESTYKVIKVLEMIKQTRGFRS